MKTNLKITFLFFYLSINTLVAQEGNLKIGPALKGISSVIDVKLNDNNLWILANDGKSSLQSWKLSPVSLIPNGEPKPVSGTKKSSGMVANSKELKYYAAFSSENKEIIFYKKTEGKDKTSQLYYQLLDESFNPAGKPNKLASRSDKGAKGGLFGWQNIDGGGFNITSNKEGDQILLVNQAPDKNKSKKETIPGEVSLTLYNADDMTEVGNGTFDFGISNYGADVVLGDDGYVYTLVFVPDGTKEERKDKKRNGEATWYYKIVGVNLYDPGAKAFEYNLIFKNKGILKASLEISNAGELICAGTYSELTKKGNIDDFDGIFYAKLDPKTGAILSDNHKKLDRSTVEFMTSKRNASKDEGVSTNFKIRGYEVLANGTSDLILEEDYYYVVTSSNGRGQTSRTYHYISKAIMIANIAGNGEINWIKHIPKFQHTTDDNGVFNSFTYFREGDKLVFVFADNSKNYDPVTFKLKPENAKNVNDMVSSKRAKSLAYAEIDGSGKTSQKLIANAKNHVLLTKYGTWSASGKEVYMQAIKRISVGECILGCLFFPYGIYLFMRDDRNCLARLELD